MNDNRAVAEKSDAGRRCADVSRIHGRRAAPAYEPLPIRKGRLAFIETLPEI